MSFVKLHGSILDSSIWSQADQTRIVWITLLAMANEDGVVEASVDGVARRAVVPMEACERSLAVLLGPDPNSRDGTTGERIEKVPGGWFILNHANYRDRRTRVQVLTAKRVAKHREKEREARVSGNEVTPDNGTSPPISSHPPKAPSEAEAEAEAEADTEKKAAKLPPRRRGRPPFDPMAVLKDFPSLGTPALEALFQTYLGVRPKKWTEQGMRLAMRNLEPLSADDRSYSIEQAIQGSYLTIHPKRRAAANGFHPTRPEAPLMPFIHEKPI